MVNQATTKSPLLISEPNPTDWDRFVTHHPHGHGLQSVGWGNLKASVGWRAQRLAIRDMHSEIVAGALLLLRPRFGLSAAYVPRGPLFSGDPAIDTALLQGLEQAAKRARAVFLRLEPNLLEQHPLSQPIRALLRQQRFVEQPPLQPRASVHLDLAPLPEQLLAGMSKGHRADIKRSTRDGVTVQAGNLNDLAAFYAIMEATSQRAQFGIHSRSYYQSVLEQFGSHARLWLALRDGTPHATAITLAWANSGLYLYSGSTTDGLKSGAQHAIQWQAIQWAREQGCSTYDFWGVPDEFALAATTSDPNRREELEAKAQQHPLYGVYRFKKGFGGSVVRYLPAFDRVYLGPLYALWQRRISG
jgi:lipid II:glycine glycyltransferase (peptidoglycan interpeptide bridge formation enzyme)